MKPLKLFLPSVALAAGLFSNAHAATIYTDGVVVNIFGPPSISASDSSGGGGNLGVISCSIDSNLLMTSVNATVGIGHNWYSVAEGTTISPDLVASGSLFGGVIGGNHLGGSIQLQPGQSFLVGFWLDSGGLDTPNVSKGDGLPGVDDRFGWARLSYTQAGGLVLLGSATLVADSSNTGIIAGTTTTVPESSALLITALAGGFALRRRRRATADLQTGGSEAPSLPPFLLVSGPSQRGRFQR